MNLHPHNDDSRREGQDLTATPTSAAPVPAVVPGKLRNGRPSIEQAPQRLDPGLRGRCWWLMRQVNTFTIHQLLETYADGTEKEAQRNLGFYLRRLEAHGVVERMDRRQPGFSSGSNGFIVWRLKRNLGVLAPVWRRLKKVLWDPNAGQIVPLKTAQAEQQDSSVQSEPDSND